MTPLEVNFEKFLVGEFGYGKTKALLNSEKVNPCEFVWNVYNYTFFILAW